jgi:hypothetical protein
VKENKNWITLGILTSCKHKRKLFVVCGNSNNPDFVNHYKIYYKILSAVIKKTKKLNYADKIKNSLNKNKTIWDIVNLETNKTVNTEKINTLNIDGSSISDRQKITNSLNKYFLTTAKSVNTQNELISHNLDNTTSLHYLTQSFKNSFQNINLKSISTKEIENIIKSLKPKNSTGYDGISIKLIQISSPSISSPLTQICNKSISLGIFPYCLKYAVVKPLFKKADKSKIFKYRPISILSSFSKVLEKVMCNQLQEHLNKYSILAEKQFGFKSDSTKNKAIYKPINKTLNALNSKFIAGGIFFI